MFRKKDEDEGSKKGAQQGGSGVSRDMRRMMERRERAADKLTRPTRKERTKPLAFLREVRGELGRVAWPTRGEVFVYTVVVLISVAFFMTVIGVMDFGFAKGVFWLISRGGN